MTSLTHAAVFLGAAAVETPATHLCASVSSRVDEECLPYRVRGDPWEPEMFGTGQGKGLRPPHCPGDFCPSGLRPYSSQEVPKAPQLPPFPAAVLGRPACSLVPPWAVPVVYPPQRGLSSGRWASAGRGQSRSSASVSKRTHLRLPRHGSPGHRPGNGGPGDLVCTEPGL